MFAEEKFEMNQAGSVKAHVIDDSLILVLLLGNVIDDDVMIELNDALMVTLDNTSGKQTIVAVPFEEKPSVHVFGMAKYMAKKSKIMGYLGHENFGAILYNIDANWWINLLNQFAQKIGPGSTHKFEGRGGLQRGLQKFAEGQKGISCELDEYLPSYLK